MDVPTHVPTWLQKARAVHTAIAIWPTAHEPANQPHSATEHGTYMPQSSRHTPCPRYPPKPVRPHGKFKAWQLPHAGRHVLKWPCFMQRNPTWVATFNPPGHNSRTALCMCLLNRGHCLVRTPRPSLCVSTPIRPCMGGCIGLPRGWQVHRRKVPAIRWRHRRPAVPAWAARKPCAVVAG